MDAIVVGRGTLIVDDPVLTSRPPGPRTATRVVLTATGEGVPESCRLLETAADAPVLVVTQESAVPRFAGWRTRGAEVLGLPAGPGGRLDVKSVLTELGRGGMTNVLVEGGAGTLGGFLDAGEIDEVHAFVAPKIFGGLAALSPVAGLGAADVDRALRVADWQVERLGDDLWIHGLGQPIA
jgi:diaminohydroxyphosphoribosylaminopyrimidine deaminase/5-amino-6-(5-phosphoribosylamino)uracil reductase